MTDLDSLLYITAAVITWVGFSAILCHLLPWDKS